MRIMRFTLPFASFAFVLVTSLPAHASIDAWLELTVPMQHPQGDDACLRKHTMIASYGVPMASVMEGLITPQLAWDQASGEHVDLNEITSGAAANLVARYVSDSYNEATHVWSYNMELDVTALKNASGTTLAGRSDTVRRAKLFLVAAAENMARLSGNRFQLRVTFVGLPSQTNVPGAKLNATTIYPYSSASTLLATYKSQLINVENMCSSL
jgi:hypothetical protein